MARRKPGFDDNDLLAADQDALRPLAERMRPRDLDEMVGQGRLLAPGAALRRSIESGHVHSMVLWGPPGCGKTTLALLLAKYADADFRAISAVLSGLPEVRQVLAEAAQRFAEGRRTVLFVDEVHRFNKAQQDAFLPHIERGTILFVGATTENPSFELNSALLSRFDTILEFNEPTEEDILQLMQFYAKQLSADDSKKLAKQMAGLSVRAIRDVCLRAERHLAREQIEKSQGAAGSVPVAPTLEYYVKTLAEYRVGRTEG